MNNNTPSNKIWAVVLSGSTVTIFCWIAKLIWPKLEIPAEVSAAITTLVGGVAGYLTPHEKPND